MSETQTHEQTPDVGKTLRERRLQRNFTLEQAAQETRIHIKFIRALEEERWADFPARVYLEGFLKCYAGYLNLDGEDLVKRFRKAFVEEMKPGFSSPMPGKRREDENRKEGEGRPLWFILGGGALVLVLAMVYVKMEERRGILERNAVSVEPALTPPPPATPAPAPASHDVRVSAKSPVWARIWVDDQVRFEGILQAGQVKSWAAQKKLRVMAGNAALVTVTVDGLPSDPASGGEINWSGAPEAVAAPPASATPAPPAPAPLAAPARKLPPLPAPEKKQ